MRERSYTINTDYVNEKNTKIIIFENNNSINNNNNKNVKKQRSTSTYGRSGKAAAKVKEDLPLSPACLQNGRITVNGSAVPPSAADEDCTRRAARKSTALAGPERYISKTCITEDVDQRDDVMSGGLTLGGGTSDRDGEGIRGNGLRGGEEAPHVREAQESECGDDQEPVKDGRKLSNLSVQSSVTDTLNGLWSARGASNTNSLKSSLSYKTQVSNKLYRSKDKLGGSSTSLSSHLKTQYSDVLGVAEKLTKFFCRTRTHTYHVQRRQKGLSLPPSFCQTTGNWVTVANLRQLDGGILDPDDRLCDVVDDRDQIIAVYTEHPPLRGGGGKVLEWGVGVTTTAASPVGGSGDDPVPSVGHSRSHTPDMFQISTVHSGQDSEPQLSILNRTDIEVTGEELNNTPPPLHVRRGSEPTLNRLSPITTEGAVTGGCGGAAAAGTSSKSHTVVGPVKKNVHNKRWSAAPVIDDEAITPPSSTPLKDHELAGPNGHVFVYLGEERGEGSGEEKNPSSSSSSSASSHHSATNTAFSRFARDTNRCSMQVLSDNPAMSRWADAAERIGGSGMSYNEMRRRDPLGGASTSPHHSRQPSLDARLAHLQDPTLLLKKGDIVFDNNSKSSEYIYGSRPKNAYDYLNAPHERPDRDVHSHARSKSTDASIAEASRSHSYDRHFEGQSFPRHERSHSHDSSTVDRQQQYSSEGYRQNTGDPAHLQQHQSPSLQPHHDLNSSRDTREAVYGKTSNRHCGTGAGEEERVLVVLNNGCGPLGIHVIPSPLMGRGGGDGGGLLVEGVEHGGRVAQDGRIQVHDRIVDINGHSLLNTTFHQAQEIFKDAMQAPALRLLVSKARPGLQRSAVSGNPSTSPIGIDPSLLIPLSMQVAVGKIPASTQATSLSARTQTVMLQSSSRRPGRHITLCLAKGPHGLGFSITTRDNPARGHAPIYIKSILPKGAAIEDGTLRIGDKLVSVNGREVVGLSQTEVANMLRKVPVGGRAILEVSRQERGVDAGAAAPSTGDAITSGNGADKEGVAGAQRADHPPSPQLPRQIGVEKAWEDSLMFPWRQRELVTLDIPVHDSERAGLGVSVKGKTSSGNSGSHGPVDLGIFVKNVIFGGAASRDGRLRENDQLVNINGLSLLGKPNSEAMNTLRVAMHQEGPVPGIITLTIARRVGGAPYIPGDALGTTTHTNSLSRSGRDSANSGASNSTGTETLGYLGGTRTASATPTQHDGSDGNTQAHFNCSGGDPLTSVLHNPVLHRLTGNTAALRNDSYYQATHDTWNNSQMTAALPPTPSHGVPEGREACVGGEEGRGLSSPTVNLPQRDTLLIQDEYSNVQDEGVTRQTEDAACLDETYASQSSLDAAGGAGFSRDQFGRQSMSEKRHATLDAKSTDTYQRNRKAREARERQRQQQDEDLRDSSGVAPPPPMAADPPPHVSSSFTPSRRFTPHHSLPGYVRRAGGSPLTAGLFTKNSQSLTRYARKAAAAASCSAVSGSDATFGAGSTFTDSGRRTAGSKRDAAACGSRSSGGKAAGGLEGGRALLGVLRGLSRSLERPNPNTSNNNGDANPSDNTSGPGRLTPPDIGPGLGMKKSSSLESLQTMVQEVTLCEESGSGRGSQTGSGRVPRGRGCNESFRAAVDRSYEAPLAGGEAGVMDTLAEEEGEASGRQVLHGLVHNGADTLTSTNKMGPVNNASKKNKGLLKGLGSMFRFGKHRKTLDSNIMAMPDSFDSEGSQPGFQQQLEPEVQQQLEPEVQQREEQDQSYSHHLDVPLSDADVSGGGCSRAERMHQLRAHHQLRHAQRNGTYPGEDGRLEPVPSPPAPDKLPPPNPEEYGLPPHRPGTRGVRGNMQPSAAASSLQYAHYANYQQIQQHLRSEEQERLKLLASRQYRDFREKHHNRRQLAPRPRPHTAYYDGDTASPWLLQRLEQSFIDEAIMSSRDCREYQSQRGPRDGGTARPVSNYYEYESVQGAGGRQGRLDTPALHGGRGATNTSTTSSSNNNSDGGSSSGGGGVMLASTSHNNNSSSSHNNFVGGNINVPLPHYHSNSSNNSNASASRGNHTISSNSSSSYSNGNHVNSSVGRSDVHNSSSGTPASHQAPLNTAAQNAVCGGLASRSRDPMAYPSHALGPGVMHGLNAGTAGTRRQPPQQQQHNSLPRRSHLHQHFTDNLPLVTGGGRQQQHQAGTAKQSSKQHQQQQQLLQQAHHLQQQQYHNQQQHHQHQQYQRHHKYAPPPPPLAGSQQQQQVNASSDFYPSKGVTSSVSTTPQTPGAFYPPPSHSRHFPPPPPHSYAPTHHSHRQQPPQYRGGPLPPPVPGSNV